MLTDFQKYRWSIIKVHLQNILKIKYSDFPFVNFLLFVTTGINLGLILLFPLNPQPTGLRVDYGALILIAGLLVNVIIHSTNRFNNNRAQITSALISSRQLSTVIILIITSLLSVCLVHRTLSIEMIITAQQRSLWHILPAWNVICHPLLFINALIIFGYFIIILQILNQTTRTNPQILTHSSERLPVSIDYSYFRIWSFSLSILIMFMYIEFFWGAGYFRAGNHGLFIVLLLKFLIFFSLSVWFYHRIPHLVEEQLLRLSYGFILPFQVVAMVLTVLTSNH